MSERAAKARQRHRQSSCSVVPNSPRELPSLSAQTIPGFEGACGCPRRSSRVVRLRRRVGISPRRAINRADLISWVEVSCKIDKQISTAGELVYSQVRREQPSGRPTRHAIGGRLRYITRPLREVAATAADSCVSERCSTFFIAASLSRTKSLLIATGASVALDDFYTPKSDIRTSTPGKRGKWGEVWRRENPPGQVPLGSRVQRAPTKLLNLEKSSPTPFVIVTQRAAGTKSRPALSRSPGSVAASVWLSSVQLSKAAEPGRFGVRHHPGPALRMPTASSAVSNPGRCAHHHAPCTAETRDP